MVTRSVILSESLVRASTISIEEFLYELDKFILVPFAMCFGKFVAIIR
jgi:hypothetical protein